MFARPRWCLGSSGGSLRLTQRQRCTYHMCAQLHSIIAVLYECAVWGVVSAGRVVQDLSSGAQQETEWCVEDLGLNRNMRGVSAGWFEFNNLLDHKQRIRQFKERLRMYVAIHCVCVCFVCCLFMFTIILIGFRRFMTILWCARVVSCVRYIEVDIFHGLYNMSISEWVYRTSTF